MGISRASITKLKEWLGKDGIQFFKEMKEEHGFQELWLRTSMSLTRM